jgi:predicted ribosomally synthesized peptide with nif11-like leader
MGIGLAVDKFRCQLSTVGVICLIFAATQEKVTMSIEAVTKFLEQAQTDDALGNRVKTVITERGAESSFELVELAAKHNFEFTATELMECLAGGKVNTELSEVELENVAGGISYLRTLLGRRDNPIGSFLADKRKTADPDK